MAIEAAIEPLEGADDSMGETLSMSLLGGNEVKPGDVVRIRVESVDENEGTWRGVYAEPDAPESSAIGEQMKRDGMMKGAM